MRDQGKRCTRIACALLYVQWHAGNALFVRVQTPAGQYYGRYTSSPSHPITACSRNASRDAVPSLLYISFFLSLKSRLVPVSQRPLIPHPHHCSLYPSPAFLLSRRSPPCFFPSSLVQVQTTLVPFPAPFPDLLALRTRLFRWFFVLL